MQSYHAAQIICKWINCMEGKSLITSVQRDWCFSHNSICCTYETEIQMEENLILLTWVNRTCLELWTLSVKLTFNSPWDRWLVGIHKKCMFWWFLLFLAEFLSTVHLGNTLIWKRKSTQMIHFSHISASMKKYRFKRQSYHRVADFPAVFFLFGYET